MSSFSQIQILIKSAWEEPEETRLDFFNHLIKVISEYDLESNHDSNIMHKFLDFAVLESKNMKTFNSEMKFKVVKYIVKSMSIIAEKNKAMRRKNRTVQQKTDIAPPPGLNVSNSQETSEFESNAEKINIPKMSQSGMDNLNAVLRFNSTLTRVNESTQMIQRYQNQKSEKMTAPQITIKKRPVKIEIIEPVIETINVAPNETPEIPAKIQTKKIRAKQLLSMLKNNTIVFNCHFPKLNIHCIDEEIKAGPLHFDIPVGFNILAFIKRHFPFPDYEYKINEVDADTVHVEL